MRFHVLGIGSIGTLIAHHLRQARPSAPISLITKRATNHPSTRLHPYGRKDDPPLRLTVERHGTVATSTGYQIENWHDGRAERALEESGRGHSTDQQPPNADIDSLIVCLKTHATVNALSVLRPRISPSTVITLLQNGMGVFDELCASLWPDPATRPQFILGTTTHGAAVAGKLGSIKHNSKPGEGEIKWGIVPDPRKELDFENWLWGRPVGRTPILSPPPSPLPPIPAPPATRTDMAPLHTTIDALLSLSHLSPSLLPMAHLHHQLLLKLALNSVINPLTAVMGAGAISNGALFGSAPALKLIKRLVMETSHTLTAYVHSLSAPHAAAPDVLRLFSPQSLEDRVLHLVRMTSGNTSSMAADVSHGRMTEVNHITGYITQLARRLGVSTPNHIMIQDMVYFTAELNGLRTGSVVNLQNVSKRKEEIRQSLGHTYQPLTPRFARIEERRMDLEERNVWVKEEQLLEHTRRRRSRRDEQKHHDWYEVVIEAVGVGKAPTPAAWRSMRRDEKQALLRKAQGLDPETGAKLERSEEEPSSLPPTTDSRAEPAASPVAPVPVESVKMKPSKSGGASWMDSLIAAAPRQERTWDIPTTSPTARGPVPKKKPAPTSTSSTPTLAPAAPKAKPTSSSSRAPTMQEMMDRAITSAPHSATLASSASPMPRDPYITSPTSPTSPLDLLISSAPRAERTWENRGGEVSGYTGQQTALPRRDADERVNNGLVRGGVGSVLDNLISASPRQERTWDDNRGDIPRKTDSGRFTTSRSSGS